MTTAWGLPAAELGLPGVLANWFYYIIFGIATFHYFCTGSCFNGSSSPAFFWGGPRVSPSCNGVVCNLVLQFGFVFFRIAACLFLDLIFGKSAFLPLFLLVHAVCTRGWILSIVSGICLFLTFASEKRVLDR